MSHLGTARAGCGLDGLGFKAAGVVLFVMVALPMAAVVPIARSFSRQLARAKRGEWVTEVARVQRVSRDELDERTRTWF